MKNLVLITALSLIAATQAMSQERGGFGNGNRGGNSGWDDSYDDSYYDDDYSDRYGSQNQKIQLHVNQHLRGQNTLKLKQMLKMQQGHINLQNMKLVAVKLVAKSKKGKGQATLIVGQNSSYSENIGGSPQDFHYPEHYTFDKIKFSNPSQSTQGKIQIKLQGNIKVKKVVLIVKKKQQRNRIQTIRIPMYDQHLRGQNVLKIKRLLKQQNPMLNMQNIDIKAVTIMAKSQRGRGQATLVVGQDESYPSTIFGSPRSFISNSPMTYSAVTMQNPSYDSQGKVQVELRGNIKVKAIIVKIKKKRNGSIYNPGRGQRVPGTGRRGGRI